MEYDVRKHFRFIMDEAAKKKTLNSTFVDWSAIYSKFYMGYNYQMYYFGISLMINSQGYEPPLTASNFSVHWGTGRKILCPSIALLG